MLNSEKTRFAIKILKFLLFALIYFAGINVIYYYIIAHTDWNFKKRIESLKFENPDFDLLVLGASLSQNGFDTEFLTNNGVKSYNLAIDGGSLKTNFIQLQEYLTKYPIKPKIVILGLNTTLDAFHDESIHPIVDFTMAHHKYTINDAPVLKFKWLGYEFLKKIYSSRHRNAKLSLGQLRFERVGIDNTAFANSALKFEKIKGSKWISEIAELCNKSKIRFIVIEMPGFKEVQNQSETGPFSIKFSNNSEAELYNFNSNNFCRIFDNQKDWIGNSHLNEYGASKLTKELAKVIFEK